MLKLNVLRKIFPFVAAVIAVLCIFTTAAIAAATPLGEFEAAVDDIKNAPSLSEKEILLSAADAKWEEYLESEGGVCGSEAEEIYSEYEKLKASIEKTVADCKLFMEYVEEAEIAWIDVNYEETRAALDNAENLLADINTTYEGISSNKSVYDRISKEVADCEKPYRLYVEAVERGLAAETYREMKQAMSEVSTREKEINGLTYKIPSYPGYSDAIAKKSQLSDMMGDIMIEAAEFISAVQEISSDTLKSGILAAYEIYEGIDSTADGVSAAKNTLDGYKKSYEGACTESGNAVESMNTIIFSVLFR